MSEPLDYLLRENPVIWVFGYGSLLWKPDFSYKSKVIGYIDGYERRFNQGNETFRGIPGKPGRVANLEEKTGSKTWGVAYEISGLQEVSKVLKNLYVRESCCGGYSTMITTFFPREYTNVDKDDDDTLFDTPVDTPVGSLTESSLKHFASLHNLDSSDQTKEDSKKEISKETNPSPSPRQQQQQQEHDEFESIFYSSSTSTPTDIPAGDRSFFQGIDDQDNITIPETSQSPSPSPEGKTVLNSLVNTVTNHPVPVLLYTATCDNSLYLGYDTFTNMAHQIVDSRGTTGTNVEYVLKITDFIRKYIPEDDDEYLFALDAKIREELYRRINLQRRTSDVIEKDLELEHHEALLNAIRISAS